MRYKAQIDFKPFEIDNSHAISTLQNLIEFVNAEGHKVYFTIDEYDSSINTALGNISIINYLRVKRTTEFTLRENTIKAGESIFKQFFSIIKMACDNYFARAFVTGVTPIVMTEFTSGFNNAMDLHLDHDFRYMYGFTKSDVMAGLNAITPVLSDTTKKAILNKWQKDDGGYFFVKEQEEGIFNPTKIMYGLYYVQKRIVYFKSDDPNLLLDYPADQNSLPAANTLNIISSQPLSRKIINDILQKDYYKSDTPIQGRFRLTDIAYDLLTIPNSLLSFLYYNGALTYQQHSYNLKVTNNTARREFFNEFCKITSLNVQDLSSYHLIYLSSCS